MEFSLHFMCALFISSISCNAVKVSKACFGSQGLGCTSHILTCSIGRIAIQEAFYMEKTKCPNIGTDCFNVNVSGMSLNGTRYNFSGNELDAVYGNCSTQTTCTLPTIRSGGAGFSAIFYRCISETIDMCNSTAIEKTDTSLIWIGSNDQNTCVCSISKSSEQTLLTLTALDMPHHCPEMTIHGVTIPDLCSTNTSYQLIYNSTEWDNIKMVVNTTNSNNTAVIWIRIQGTEHLNLVCNQNPKETTVAATTVKSTMTKTTWTKASKGTTPTTSTFTSTASFSRVPVDQTTNAEIGTATTVKSTMTKTTWTNASKGTTPTTSTFTSTASFSRVPVDQTTNAEIGTEIIGTTTSVISHGNNTRVYKDDESNTGTIVGIIVPLCILMAVVVTAVILFRRRKLRQKEGNGKATNLKTKPKEVYLMERKQSPDYDYATTNVYLDLVPEAHNNNSKHLGEADDNHYHQVEHLQTQLGFTESNHSGGNKTKFPHQTTKNDHADADSTNGLYHELEPRTDNGSTDDDVASGMAGLVKSPARKGSSEYMLAGNITKQDKESQHAVKVIKGSSDYDYAGGNTYHVLEQQPPQKDSSDYDYAEENNYHEVEPQKGLQSSDYDYARCGDQQASHNHHHRPNTEKRDSDYDHIGRRPARENGHYDTTVSGKLTRGNANEEVYSYNHLNERKASNNDDADSTYNTTASTRHRMDASTNDSEDDYGYNHLGPETKKNIPQNEYDTAASAIQDVARMNGEMEDSTYDHAHLVTQDCSQSGMTNADFEESDYDHAFQTNTLPESESNAASLRSHQEEGGTDVYKLAQEAEANPYQLAK